MTRARTNADQAHTESLSVEPHIIPGVLYPAVAGKLLDGSTSHSGNYGTAQADGFSYYYTDIKGSKPIKDPRIGGHFGSQRHKFKSLQLLEQETRIQGQDIKSVDGREWIRAFVNGIDNTSEGTPLKFVSTNNYIEVTGYFSDVSLLFKSGTAWDNFTYSIDGASSVNVDLSISVNSPLGSRYVDAASLHNFGLGLTLGIHTIKFIRNGDGYFYGIELIAQDTTSTATKSQIQIPSQNVVSYGKKFTVSGTPHYNPFAFKTDGTTAWASGAHNGTSWPVGTGSSANIDTATSLGLSAWISTNYYKPYNGGRVVWWIDSSGTLKCSVNMMPPNARNVSSTASNEKGDDSAGTTSAAVANNTYLPTFTDQAIDQSQAEVAKSFHWREFGNGSANGNASYPDASTIASSFDDIAYVMDDGLTSMNCDQVKSSSGHPNLEDAAAHMYITFIGTGLSATNTTLVQNLPYGTHIIKFGAGSGVNPITCDGSVVHTNLNIMNSSGGAGDYLNFHQPKKPPIPENAVVLADYMLMADFVAQTPTQNDGSKISKGTRLISSSRDFFYDTGGSNYAQGSFVPLAESWVGECKTGLAAFFNGNTNDTNVILPYFGNTSGEFTTRGVGDAAPIHVNLTNSSGTLETTNVAVASNLTISSQPTIPQGGSSAANTHTFSKSDGVLGLNQVKLNADGSASSTYDWLYFGGMTISTPIHTSSHYQPFETPFLHELVGGDRNMEQTNLVVAPDGKTWDEVTRDTSYIGSVTLRTNTDTHSTSNSSARIFDEWRGQAYGTAGKNGYMNKDFAIAYDRVICLKTGHYRVYAQTKAQGNNNGLYCAWHINGTESVRTVVHNNSSDGSVENNATTEAQFYLIRGDYLQLIGRWYNGLSANTVLIERV